MTSATVTVDVAAIVQQMNRRALVYQLTYFNPGFKLDFSPEFLASRSNEQLRHILLAAYLQARTRQRRAARPAVAVPIYVRNDPRRTSRVDG